MGKIVNFLIFKRISRSGVVQYTRFGKQLSDIFCAFFTQKQTGNSIFDQINAKEVTIMPLERHLTKTLLLACLVIAALFAFERGEATPFCGTDTGNHTRTRRDQYGGRGSQR